MQEFVFLLIRLVDIFRLASCALQWVRSLAFFLFYLFALFSHVVYIRGESDRGIFYSYLWCLC